MIGHICDSDRASGWGASVPHKVRRKSQLDGQERGTGQGDGVSVPVMGNSLG